MGWGYGQMCPTPKGRREMIKLIRRIIEFLIIWKHCCFTQVYDAGTLGIKHGTKLAWDLAETIVEYREMNDGSDKKRI